ncbi:aspartate aminotransferase family protein [Parvibaculum sp.]|uniref:aspartate aminotransferase family protein n=1 Tax=Parvibaculum sp. TaxID=2024848 RepID=UPI002730C769|nr:aspartate aminotransferase family protein [Parvibaculum sp.]MDP1626436.1 aspartate aminotransferase family protein [Parvibaculum sp.]MDP2150358.1 aspartate aminotransferase family protein [Parvibaculum sp.]MDP3327888.1 aspartate aminotransferase family protein [Parvibaculum sp.]
MITPVLPTYARADLEFERGEGPYLITADGERYLDFGAGIAVNAFGHAHPHLVSALAEQAGKVWHTSNVYRIPGQEKLARRLVEATFADTVFFTNSGAEALECAIKMARKYHAAGGAPERYELITMEGAFHGRTLATIAAGGQKKYLEGFGPAMPGFPQVPFGDLKALKAAIGPATAGILIEPIQGEGGIRVLPPEDLRRIREMCDEAGILLVFDEVQTGMGRTGTLFAHELAGVTPDIMAIAKALGGGFPVGACLATEEAARGMTAGTHGSTFGGNPLAMAVANAVMDLVLDEKFLPHVRMLGLKLRQKLAMLADRYPRIIEDVRGEGLMLGIKCRVPNTDLVAALRTEKLLAVGAGDNVVRLLPPLTIEESHLDEAMEKLGHACAALDAALDKDAKVAGAKS